MLAFESGLESKTIRFAVSNFIIQSSFWQKNIFRLYFQKNIYICQREIETFHVLGIELDNHEELYKERDKSQEPK